MPRIFAYIVHRGGVADDSAAELLAARQNDRCLPSLQRCSPAGVRISILPVIRSAPLPRDLEGRQPSPCLSQCRIRSSRRWYVFCHRALSSCPA